MEQKITIHIHTARTLLLTSGIMNYFFFFRICSKIYCSGDVLHTIQMAKLFNDSKTFVDMKLKRPPNETVELFHEFMNEHDQNPSREDIIQFVSVSFDAFEHASPPLLEQDPIRKRQQSKLYFDLADCQLFCTVSSTSASNAVYTQQWNKLTQFTIRHRNIQSTSYYNCYCYWYGYILYCSKILINVELNSRNGCQPIGKSRQSI